MFIQALFCVASTFSVVSVQDGAWSDPSTWDTHVPSSNDTVEVGNAVQLNGSGTARSVLITEDGSLAFLGTVHLNMFGNLEVRGLLTQQTSPNDVQRLTFNGIDEANFVGGGDEVLASDVGLWVVGSGRWTAHGTPKTAWTHLVSAGVSSIIVDDAAGWLVGDEVVVAPTSSPLVANFSDGFDRHTIANIAGNIVTFADTLVFPHPAVPAYGWRAEVLNLSRNIIVEGQVNGRSHIAIIDSHQTVDLSYVEIRNMGPRKAVPGSNSTEFVVGRYALHLHHGDDDTLGSLIEGLSVHDCGSHAYVTHRTNGVTIRDSISFATKEDAYWFDPGEENGSDFLLFDHNVAALVQTGTTATDRRLTGFRLGSGEDNEVRDCVAVGVQGRDNASGFQWPEGSSSVWTFSGNVSHNNKADGVFVWQNGHTSQHVVGGLTAYHCGDVGIEHGAYFNSYVWEDADIYGCGVAGVGIEATSGKDTPLTFRNIKIDGGGVTPTGWAFRVHNATKVSGVLVSYRGLIEGGFVRNLKSGGKAFAGAFVGLPSNNWFDLWTIKNVDVSTIPEALRFDVSLWKPGSNALIIKGQSTVVLHTVPSTLKWGGSFSDLTPTFSQ